MFVYTCHAHVSSAKNNYAAALLQEAKMGGAATTKNSNIVFIT